MCLFYASVFPPAHVSGHHVSTAPLKGRRGRCSYAGLWVTMWMLGTGTWDAGNRNLGCREQEQPVLLDTELSLRPQRFSLKWHRLPFSQHFEDLPPFSILMCLDGRLGWQTGERASVMECTKDHYSGRGGLELKLAPLWGAWDQYWDVSVFFKWQLRRRAKSSPSARLEAIHKALWKAVPEAATPPFLQLVTSFGSI